MAKATQIKRLERLERQQTALLALMDRQHGSGDYDGLKKSLALSKRVGVQLEMALKAVS